MYYLSIKKAKNGEPYVRLVRETLGGPSATDKVVLWSETYRSMSGVRKLLRVMGDRDARRIMVKDVSAQHSYKKYPIVYARNFRTLMSGNADVSEEVLELVNTLNGMNWSGVEVRDERRG